MTTNAMPDPSLDSVLKGRNNIKNILGSTDKTDSLENGW